MPINKPIICSKPKGFLVTKEFKLFLHWLKTAKGLHKLAKGTTTICIRQIKWVHSYYCAIELCHTLEAKIIDNMRNMRSTYRLINSFVHSLGCHKKIVRVHPKSDYKVTPNSWKRTRLWASIRRFCTSFLTINFPSLTSCTERLVQDLRG